MKRGKTPAFSNCWLCFCSTASAPKGHSECRLFEGESFVGVKSLN